MFKCTGGRFFVSSFECIV